MRLIERLIDPEQLPTLCSHGAQAHQSISMAKNVGEVAESVMKEIEKRGISVLGNARFCQVRKQDFMAVMNKVSFRKK